MCTVTITPLEAANSFVLTSNRDEAPGRATLAPEFYAETGTKMLYPKDGLAGGTWLGISDQQRVICLLNGGFEQHQRTPPYKMSRGIVVRDLLRVKDFNEAVEGFDLSEVEPFTVIAAEWKEELCFSELVWDGSRKHLRELPLAPHIWSSSPLYNQKMKDLREEWFTRLQEHSSLTPKTLLNFHYTAGKGDKEAGIIMDRGFVKTQSVSQIIHTQEKTSFFYRNLVTDETKQVNF